MEIRSSGLQPIDLDFVPILDTSIDPLASPLGPSNRSPRVYLLRGQLAKNSQAMDRGRHRPTETASSLGRVASARLGSP
jgi:hypothetical protein